MELRKLAVAVVTAASLYAASPARATEVVANAPDTAPLPEPKFGSPRTWVFTFQTADQGTGSFFFHKTSGGGSTISIDPGADYFLAPDISLGANIVFSHDSSGGNVFGGGVRAGYNLPLIDAVSFWPMARFFVIRYDRANTTATNMSILAPFLWHLAPHFFLGAGPDVNIGISGYTNTVYGIDFMLGGWI
jgi:hypothetical protein